MDPPSRGKKSVCSKAARGMQLGKRGPRRCGSLVGLVVRGLNPLVLWLAGKPSRKAPAQQPSTEKLVGYFFTPLQSSPKRRRTMIKSAPSLYRTT